MIAEGNDFETLIRNELFLQPAVHFGCGNGRLSCLFNASLYLGVDTSLKLIDYAKRSHAGYSFQVIGPGEVLPERDVVFAHEAFKAMSIEEVNLAFETFRAPRILVTEILGDRGFMFYNDVASRFGYSLHRCIFVPSPRGEIAFMEFQEMERT